MKLLRGDGPPIRVGHRGAALLAPENTLAAFETALAVGVDAIEFDVLDLVGGPLVLAHSNDLHEVSHGVAAGTVRDRSLAELREVAPALPTLDEALAFFADRPEVAVHVDLKLTERLDELAAALERHDLVGRTVVSSFHRESLRAVARAVPGVRIGVTYPEDRSWDRAQADPPSGNPARHGRASGGAPAARAGDARERRRKRADAPSGGRLRRDGRSRSRLAAPPSGPGR